MTLYPDAVIVTLATTVAALAAYVAKLHSERVADLKADREADQAVAAALRDLANLHKPTITLGGGGNVATTPSPEQTRDRSGGG